MAKDSKQETLTSGLDVTDLLREIGNEKIKLSEFKKKIAAFAEGKEPEVLLELFQEKLEKMNPEVVVGYFSETNLSKEAKTILTKRAESVDPKSPIGLLTYFISLTPGGLDKLETLPPSAKVNMAKALAQVKLSEYGAGSDGAVNESNAVANIFEKLQEQTQELRNPNSPRGAAQEFEEEALEQKNGIFDRIVNSLSSMFENISEFFSAITGSISGLFSSKSSAEAHSEVSLLGDSRVDISPDLERRRGSSVTEIDPSTRSVDDASKTTEKFVESARARSGSELRAPSAPATSPVNPRSGPGAGKRSR